MIRRSHNPVLRMYEYVSMSIGLGLFALICLGSIPLFVLLYFGLPQRFHRSASRRVISKGFRCYLWCLKVFCIIRVDFGVTPTSCPERLVVISNHPSLLDAVILFARFPNATCVIKDSLLRNILFGVGARMAGYISNKNTETMIEQAQRELSLGSQLIIFPEGGRSRDFPVSPFSTASMLIAKLAQTPIQCVFLDFSSPYLGKSWGLFNPPVLPLDILMRDGEQLAPPANATQLRMHLETYYRDNVVTPWLENSA